jgi:hypothetical protein
MNTEQIQTYIYRIQIKRKYLDKIQRLLPSRYLKKQLIRSFYIRYGNDWIVLTNGTTEYANNLKEKITHFLKEELKLTLSSKKTKVTNMKIKHARFLGFQL